MVSVALDSELHREVALKQVLDSHADDPISRQRFLLEAEVTGGLEHPGIVPVYGLGTYAGGRPYYAMRFIRRDSLKEDIDRFHADEALKRDPGRHSLDLRKLLRRFLDVCNAIDYAHSRGVLHRDIRPGNITLGRALEAVCLKAMALDPADRYATPKALGEEVERWMADEAVAAYRESWTRTLTRWLTRHRTGVTAIGAAMLMALAGLMAVQAVQARANGQLTVKKGELDVAFRRETDARKEAETNFIMAQHAVDDYLTRVSENTLLKQRDSVDLRGLRQELLENALTYYKRFVAQRGNDSRLRQSHPDQPRYHHDLGRSLNIQGYLHDEARQNRPAIEVFYRATAEQSLAVAAAPDVDLYKLELCSQLDNLGEQYVDLGQVSESLPHYRREIAMLQELLSTRPGNPDYALKLAEALTKLGNIERHDGDSASAEESSAGACKTLEPIASVNAAVRGRLGTNLVQEAVALADLKKTVEAISLLRRTVEMLSISGASSTKDDQSREWLGESLWELARTYRARGETRQAAESDARRVALWEIQPPVRLASEAMRQTAQAVLIGYGKTPLTDAARSVRQLDLDEAAANLRLAISLGFIDASSSPRSLGFGPNRQAPEGFGQGEGGDAMSFGRPVRIVGQVEQCARGRFGLKPGSEVDEMEAVRHLGDRRSQSLRQVVDGPRQTGRVGLESTQRSVNPKLAGDEHDHEFDSLLAAEAVSLDQDRFDLLKLRGR